MFLTRNKREIYPHLIILYSLRTTEKYLNMKIDLAAVHLLRHTDPEATQTHYKIKIYQTK